MEKVWIVGALSNEALPASFEEIAEGFGELKRRVSGQLVLAMVPRSAADLDLINLAKNTGLGVQLILPQEETATLSALPKEIRSLWGTTISSPEIGINILPGRGTSPADWDDAEVWLDELAEIVFCPKTSDLSASNGSRPTVFRDPVADSWIFDHFPDSCLLNDLALETISRKTFRTQSQPQTLAEHKNLASKIANRWGPAYRMLETLTLILNLGPSLVLAFGALLIWEGKTISVWKFGFALAASLFALGVKWLALQKRWIHARAVAEICRSLAASTPILGPLYPVTARFLPNYSTLAQSLALSAFGNGEQSMAPDAVQFRDWYLENRLDKQIAYYEPRSHRAIQFHRRMKRLFGVALTLSLVSTTYTLLEKLGWSVPFPDEVSQRYISGFATFAFPALAAAALGIIALHESSRRAEFYGQICQRLRRHRAFLARLQSPSSIREAIREIEEILTEEVAGWLRRRVF